jgi:hypothetical protein
MPTQPNEEKHYLTLETKNEKFTSILMQDVEVLCLHIDMTILILQ